MKIYTNLSLPVVFACLVGSCAIALLSLAIIVANSLGPGPVVQVSYYLALDIPTLSVLLPAIGMAVLTPVALFQAFKREVLPPTARRLKPQSWRLQ